MDTIVLDQLALHSQEILAGSSEELIDELLVLNGSSAGARPKAMIQLSDDHNDMIHGSQPLKEGYSHWMVKFASGTDHPEIGAIEYAYSLMAKEAGGDARTALLEGKKGNYFACERFDRIGDTRVHVHSVAGLVHSDFRFPSLDYDDLLSLSLHLSKNIQEQEKVFRLACFNLFAHNRDDHAKNFSFLMDEHGAWKFSPITLRWWESIAREKERGKPDERASLGTCQNIGLKMEPPVTRCANRWHNDARCGTSGCESQDDTFIDQTLNVAIL
jgi:serine/threonine-protein kinase HipA